MAIARQMSLARQIRLVVVCASDFFLLNFFALGLFRSAWMPKTSQGTRNWLFVGFTTPVFATAISIRETMSVGFVRQVTLIDEFNNTIPIFSGVDSTTACPGNYTLQKSCLTIFVTKKNRNFCCRISKNRY